MFDAKGPVDRDVMQIATTPLTCSQQNGMRCLAGNAAQARGLASHSTYKIDCL
ncbi:hypothetical protein ACFFYR_02800 [Paraburkholderia dipogonis]|uniref:hypothetical protein n=1 Tax=Paraburkholderia dipogonis TaxID=1211383 RepID=UPI0035EE3D9B